MAVCHRIHHLVEENPGLALSDIASIWNAYKLVTLYVLQQFSTFQVLHHENHIHIVQGETVEDFHDTLMRELLEHLSLTKHHINILPVIDKCNTSALPMLTVFTILMATRCLFSLF
jgi:hypothetical protein